MKPAKTSNKKQLMPGTPLTANGLGSVLVLYFDTIKSMVYREQWMTKWANDAAAEGDLPKTRKEFALALKAALSTGVFWGIEECRAVLPKGLT